MRDFIYLGTIVLVIIVFVAVTFLQNLKIKRLMNRYESFMNGKDAENLGDAIEENFKQMNEIQKDYEATKQDIDETLQRMKSTFHKMGIVKYDAFKEMGGNLSFTLCLLDDMNTGFILNTMHGRDSSYTYVKEIIKGEAYATLGEEEKEALEKAINS
ncbi:MAG TPA: DUF4446 domain-containing protein [Eubacterium sp.]|nr:DUF4446 domain-containing protein [Eubacterium sp.]